MQWRFLGGATALVLASAATAQAVNYDAAYARFTPSDTVIARAHSPAFRQCMNQSGGVTVNMRDCSSAEYDRVDAQLNANYRRVMSRLSPAGQQRLRASQRRWLQVRYDACRNNPALEGGTLDLIILDACALDELTRRTLWLGQL